MDEHGERNRKSFSGTTKAEVNKKMTDYIADFEKQVVESDESKKTLQDSMQNWLQALSPRQVADLLGHSTSQITELYYVKKDTARLSGITEGFEI